MWNISLVWPSVYILKRRPHDEKVFWCSKLDLATELGIAYQFESALTLFALTSSTVTKGETWAKKERQARATPNSAWLTPDVFCHVWKDSQFDFLNKYCFIRFKIHENILFATGQQVFFYIIYIHIHTLRHSIFLGTVRLRKKHFLMGNILRLGVPNNVQITCNYLTDLTKEDFVIA